MSFFVVRPSVFAVLLIDVLDLAAGYSAPDGGIHAAPDQFGGPTPACQGGLIWE